MKRIRWAAVLTFPIMTGFIYFAMGWVVFPNNLAEFSIMEHALINSVGLGFTLFMLVQNYPVSNSKQSWWRLILSALGFFAQFAALFGAVPVLLFLMTSNSTELASYDPVFFNRISIFVKLYPYILTYLIFCILFIWNRCVVPNGTFIIVDGKILRTGTEFILWPWFSYKVTTIKEKMELFINQPESDPKRFPWRRLTLEISCRDGNFTVDLKKVEILFDIQGMQRMNFQPLNNDEFLKNLKGSFVSAFSDYARNVTLGHLLTKRPESPLHFYPNNIHVQWNGDAIITLKQ